MALQCKTLQFHWLLKVYAAQNDTLIFGKYSTAIQIEPKCNCFKLVTFHYWSWIFLPLSGSSLRALFLSSKSSFFIVSVIFFLSYQRPRFLHISIFLPHSKSSSLSFICNNSKRISSHLINDQNQR